MNLEEFIYRKITKLWDSIRHIWDIEHEKDVNLLKYLNKQDNETNWTNYITIKSIWQNQYDN